MRVTAGTRVEGSANSEAATRGNAVGRRRTGSAAVRADAVAGRRNPLVPLARPVQVVDEHRVFLHLHDKHGAGTVRHQKRLRQVRYSSVRRAKTPVSAMPTQHVQYARWAVPPGVCATLRQGARTCVPPHAHTHRHVATHTQACRAAMTPATLLQYTCSKPHPR
jgi:hypothetical protein